MISKIADFFISQKHHVFLWLPVVFASGIGVYFSLKTEPDFAMCFLGFVLTSFVLYDCQKNHLLKWILLIIWLFYAGFIIGQIHTYQHSFPKIKIAKSGLKISGRIENLVELTQGKHRFVLDKVQIKGFEQWQTPKKLWINIDFESDLPNVGDTISFVGRVTPPLKAVLPNSFDFARYLYFQKVGGIGQVQKDLKVLKKAKKSSIRQAINNKIDNVLQVETASIAKALITGDAKSIPKNIAENYQKAGITHILSVSGLHMALIAGLVFFLIRFGLVFIPRISVCYDTKKIAAIIALIVSYGYLQISGNSFPAERSFIMLCFVLIAVLVHRTALSIVSVAWAFFIILLLKPSAIISAGFQLSFSAVIALVAVYQHKKENPTITETKIPFLLSSFLNICLVTITAFFATLPFVLYHFQSFAIYGLLGNILTNFVASLIVMPCLMFATFLMPLGFERFLLILAGFWIELINKCADFVAGLPFAVIKLHPLPEWGLFMGVIGLLWLCLWQGKIRFLGFIPYIICLISPIFSTRPDMIITPKLVAFQNDKGEYLYTSTKAEPFILKALEQAYPNVKFQETTCPKDVCIYEKDKAKIGYALSKYGAYQACERTDLDLLYITKSFDDKCFSKNTIYQESLQQKGVVLLKVTNDKIKETSLQSKQGWRLWQTSQSHQRLPSLNLLSLRAIAK